MAQETPTIDPLILPDRNPVIHNAAIIGTILCPLVMLLPPRKMDARFFVLAGAFSLSTNQLAYAYTGESIYGRVFGRMSSMVDVSLPEGAKRTQQLIKEQRERDRDAAMRRCKEEEDKGVIGKVVEDVWMGGEGKDWKKKRAEEHAKQFEEGKGMADIIMDQISDVWNGRWGAGSQKTAEEAKATEESEKK